MSVLGFFPRRPRRADAARNFDAIVEVAGRVFAEDGTQAPLDDIARRAGVGPGTLYRHFPSRDCLIVAVLQEELGRLLAAAPTLREADDPGAALKEWALWLAVLLHTMNGLPDTMSHALEKDPESPLALSCQALREQSTVLFDRAQEAGALRRDVSLGDFHSVASAAAWAVAHRGGGEAELSRMLDLFWSGVGPA